MIKFFKVMISLNGHHWENEKKKKATKNQDKISYQQINGHNDDDQKKKASKKQTESK